MTSLKKMTEELHLSNGKHPLLQWSTATAGGKFEKSSTIGKGFPIKRVGAGTVHFMKSLFSEPGGLPSMGLHRVGHDWNDLAVYCIGVFLSGLLHSV